MVSNSSSSASRSKALGETEQGLRGRGVQVGWVWAWGDEGEEVHTPLLYAGRVAMVVMLEHRVTMMMAKG